MDTWAKYLVAFLAWEGFSLAYSVFNLELMQTFSSPFTVTAIHMWGGLLLLIPLWLAGLSNWKASGIQYNKMVPVAMLHAVGHLCTVVLAGKPGLLSPACQITRSLEPFFVAIMAAFARPQSVHFVVLLALLPLCIGAGIAAAPALKEELSWKAFWGPSYSLSLLATLCNSLRMVMSWDLMRQYKGVLSGTEFLAVITNMAFMGIVPFTLILEGREVAKAWTLLTAWPSTGWNFAKLAVSSGLCFYGANTAAFIVLYQTDAITTSVFGVMRRTLGMLILAIVVGHELALRKVVGAVLALVACYGVVLARVHFTLVRPKPKAAAAKMD